MITIRPYYPIGSKRSTRSALSRRAHGVYVNATDAEPAFVTFGYPSWLFKNFKYKAMDMHPVKMPAFPTPAQAREKGLGIFGELSE